MCFSWLKDERANSKERTNAVPLNEFNSADKNELGSRFDGTCLESQGLRGGGWRIRSLRLYREFATSLHHVRETYLKINTGY